MTFREAKKTIREALRDATDAKLVELLEAARAGKVPFRGTYGTSCPVTECGCLSERLHGREYESMVPSMATLSDAYADLVGADNRRQRILVAMVLTEQWWRNRPHDNTEALQKLARAVEVSSQGVERNPAALPVIVSVSGREETGAALGGASVAGGGR